MGEKKDSKATNNVGHKDQDRKRLLLLEHLIRLEDNPIIKRLENELGQHPISFDSYLDQINTKLSFDIFFGNILDEE